MVAFENYSAVIKRLDGQQLSVTINENINFDRLETIYYGYEGPKEVELRFIDPRRFSAEQRMFIYALIGDIFNATGQPSDFMKEYFKIKFEGVTGRTISLSNNSKNTMSDATLFANIILEFIFENDIPFKKGYEILPFNQSYFFYLCIAHRMCCSCGKLHAHIHHVDAVGMGNNRNKIDNRNRRFMALCGECHQLIHEEGYKEFTEKRQLYAIKLDEMTLKRLGLNVIEDEEGKNTEEQKVGGQ